MPRNNYDKLLLALKQIHLNKERKTITLFNYDALHGWSIARHYKQPLDRGYYMSSNQHFHYFL